MYVCPHFRNFLWQKRSGQQFKSHVEKDIKRAREYWRMDNSYLFILILVVHTNLFVYFLVVYGAGHFSHVVCSKWCTYWWACAYDCLAIFQV